MEQHISLYLTTLLITVIIQIYFYLDSVNVKKKNKKYLEILYNQLTKEQILRDHYNSEITKNEEIEKEFYQNLVTLRIDLINVDFSYNEIFTKNIFK